MLKSAGENGYNCDPINYLRHLINARVPLTDLVDDVFTKITSGKVSTPISKALLYDVVTKYVIDEAYPLIEKTVNSSPEYAKSKIESSGVGVDP